MAIESQREVGVVNEEKGPAASGSRSEPGAGPLAGVRIVAIEQFGAGPIATMFLSDLGAEVIKVEDPGAGGDVSRYVPPSVGGSSLFFESFNRGKRSIMLDLKHPSGRAVFERLIASADALLCNLRGDQVSKLRLTYADLAPLNPAIVCLALTGYGRRGESAFRPGLDHMIQAEAGWAYTTGSPEDPPIKSGLSLVDYVTGMISAMGVLSGLHRARTTGRGSDVDVSLYDSALSMLTYPAAWFLSAGIPTQRLPLSAHPSLVPFQFFATANGYIAVCCAKEAMYRELVAIIGLADLADDPRFNSFAVRRQHRDEILGILSARLKERTSQEWLGLFKGRVPSAPVRRPEEAMDLAELIERDMLAEYDHAVLGRVRAIGSPIHFSDYQPVYRPGPGLGADSDAILAELGFSNDEIKQLRVGWAFDRGTAAEAE